MVDFAYRDREACDAFFKQIGYSEAETFWDTLGATDKFLYLFADEFPLHQADSLTMPERIEKGYLKLERRINIEPLQKIDRDKKENYSLIEHATSLGHLSISKLCVTLHREMDKASESNQDENNAIKCYLLEQAIAFDQLKLVQYLSKAYEIDINDSQLVEYLKQYAPYKTLQSLLSADETFNDQSIRALLKSYSNNDDITFRSLEHARERGLFTAFFDYTAQVFNKPWFSSEPLHTEKHHQYDRIHCLSVLIYYLYSTGKPPIQRIILKPEVIKIVQRELRLAIDNRNTIQAFQNTLGADSSIQKLTLKQSFPWLLYAITQLRSKDFHHIFAGIFQVILADSIGQKPALPTELMIDNVLAPRMQEVLEGYTPYFNALRSRRNNRFPHLIEPSSREVASQTKALYEDIRNLALQSYNQEDTRKRMLEAKQTPAGFIETLFQPMQNRLSLLQIQQNRKIEMESSEMIQHSVDSSNRWDGHLTERDMFHIFFLLSALAILYETLYALLLCALVILYDQEYQDRPNGIIIMLVTAVMSLIWQKHHEEKHPNLAVLRNQRP